MRIKLDENLGRRGENIFKSAGHDVATVASQALCSASDAKLIGVCRDEGRCLVTLDLHFSNPLIFKPDDYPGIAVLRLPPRSSPNDLIATMELLAAEFARSSIHGRLWIVERHRVRQYQPE